MFTIKALSPDNDGEIRKLISLYKSVYKDSYPINQVYELDFWKTHIGTKLISVGVFLGKEIVAHFAIKNDLQSFNLKRLCLLAESSLSDTERSTLTTLLKDFLYKFCKKNQIKALYSFSYANHWIQSSIDLGHLGGTDCLLCPRYLPETHTKAFINSAEPGERISVLISALIPSERQVPSVYISQIGDHQRIAEKTFKSMSYKLLKENKPEQDDASTSSFSSYINEKIGVSHYYIKPSKVADQNRVIKNILSDSNFGQLVFVDVQDEGTPEFCHFLEEHDFKICGFSPQHNQMDAIVFFKDLEKDFPSLSLFNSSDFEDIYKHITNYKAERQITDSETYLTSSTFIS
ncbi:MAG: hypothetical protein KDD56_08705 [Bdellovibrionales bacterium]|nr:hypothetical protein [Bdellovibrionales bacterium]